MKKLNNKKAGFSLVELMVVVAIIGILASIAVPNFLKFQAKAKQSDAKVQLSGLHAAQKTFFAEYSTFHSNLTYIGFVPDGLALTAGCPATAAAATGRRYSVGLTDAVVLGIVGGVAITCGAAAGSNGRTYYSSDSATTAPVPAAAPANQGTLTATAFSAVASGNIGGAAVDIWSITQDKVITNDQSGI